MEPPFIPRAEWERQGTDMPLRSGMQCVKTSGLRTTVDPRFNLYRFAHSYLFFTTRKYQCSASSNFSGYCLLFATK
jgi:hypothetical protein